MELSKLHFHSWGLVSVNKALGDNTIQVIPIEYRFGAIETVLDQTETHDVTYPTDEGEASLKLVSGSSVTATWLKLNSNRITPPDVRRNSQVLIWRLGDTDKYYWSDLAFDNVKRLETVTYAWSADPANPIKDDLSNAYYLEISTHGKAITLQTSQTNGEPFGYTIQLNTDHGVFQLTDTAGNSLYLNSEETTLGMINANGTEFKLQADDIFGYAPNNIDWIADKDITFQCTNFTLQAKESVSIDSQTTSLQASASMSLTSQTFTASASTMSLSASSLAMTSSGGATVSGGLKIDNLEVDDLKAKKADFESHGPH